jgi:hypothetical protein
MATMKQLFELTEERETLIIRIADMASILRSVRVNGAAIPVVCLVDCTARHWIRWGEDDRCTNCGTPALSADIWHRMLTEALRAHAALSAAQLPLRRAA